MKNEHKRGKMRVIHYGQIERKERMRERAIKEKESTPQRRPTAHSHMHMLDREPYAESGLL